MEVHNLDVSNKECVIVAHPYKQHSYKLATALVNSNRLLKYSTTVYDKPRTVTSNLKRFLPSKYKKLLEKKKCEFIKEDHIKTFNQLGGLLFIFIARIPGVRIIYRQVGALLIKSFGIKVAKYAIKMNASAVVMYDTTADECFKYLRKNAPHIKRILDMSSNASIERLKLYNSIDEIEVKSGLKREFKYLWSKKFQSRNSRELLNTNYFLTPSNFSKNSIKKQGIPEEKLYVVPYGVDVKHFSYIPKEKKVENKIKLVYTGVISYEKGVNYLLKAISELPVDKFEISLMGAYSKKSPIFQKYNGYKNIKFKGYVTHEELADIYHEADAFVMASLGEGFTLSGLEAMASGLPIICSENSGINDAIISKENGLIFPICDVEAIKNSLMWIYDNSNKLPELSRNAHDTAMNYTWEEYYNKINMTFDNILNEK